MIFGFQCFTFRASLTASLRFHYWLLRKLAAFLTSQLARNLNASSLSQSSRHPRCWSHISLSQGRKDDSETRQTTLLDQFIMPDINTVSRKHTISPTPSETSTTPEAIEYTDLVIPDACLACGKEKVTHLTVPCRHPCLCRACAMKMATGGRCKVVPFHQTSSKFKVCKEMFVELKRLEAVA